MKKMVSLLQPFTMQQTLIVYENGNKLDVITTSIKDFPETVYKTSLTYNCSELEFMGTTKFAKGIGKQIEELGISKYNSKEIKITYK